MKKQLFFISLAVLVVRGQVCTQTAFWVPTSGPGGGSVNALAVRSDGMLFAATGGTGVYRTSDNGDTWTQVNNGLSNTIVNAIVVGRNGYVYVGTSGGGVFRTTDSGGFWTQVNNGLTNLGILSLGVDSIGGILAGTNASGIFRSTDNGSNWTHVSLQQDIVAIVITPGGTWLCGTNVPCCRGVLRSTNNGTDWTLPLPAGSDIRALALSVSGSIFASTNGHGVFRSTDDGVSWLPASSGLQSTVISLVGNPIRHMFAGLNSGGVARSVNDGSNWIRLDSASVEPFARSLASNQAGYVFAGTNSLVYRSTQPTSVSDGQLGLPSAIRLMQNYPNPFNPSTTIEFHLPASGHASVRIFDLLGEHVETLVDEQLPAGRHRISWHAQIASTGMYFCRLRVSDVLLIRKLLLLK